VTKILIAGAGIGGLTAALALQDAGFEVRVFERAPLLREVGAGIQLSPNGMRVMDALGLRRALENIAFHPQGLEFRLYQSGFTVMRMPFGEASVRRYGMPYLHLHRADFLDVLSEAVRDRMGDVIETGRTVARVEQTAGGASLIFSDGSREDGDAVIGCDGIHSVVREGLLGPEKPEFTGHVAWRGVIPVERLAGLKLKPVLTSWMSPHGHAVTYFLRRGQLLNFVGVEVNQNWQSESWTERGSKEELRAVFKDWHPTVRGIVEQIDEPYRWALFTRRPLQKWSEGRVTLLGDACHPMLPYMAQGAVMGVEDAYVLRSCLKAEGDIPAALKRYEELRLKRTARVQATARANGRMFHLSRPLEKLIGFGRMALGSRLAPEEVAKVNDWIFGYDATGVV
jgi:salicylate hydroxylase